jgi:hypothetical protein
VLSSTAPLRRCWLGRPTSSLTSTFSFKWNVEDRANLQIVLKRIYMKWGVDSFHGAQNTIQGRQWTFGFHKWQRISWLAKRLSASQKGLCCKQEVQYCAAITNYTESICNQNGGLRNGWSRYNTRQKGVRVYPFNKQHVHDSSGELHRPTTPREYSSSCIRVFRRRWRPPCMHELGRQVNPTGVLITWYMNINITTVPVYRPDILNKMGSTSGPVHWL